MKIVQKYWIKQRHNPQLGTYWVACGQMTKRAAKQQESPLYGDNVMHPFETKESYDLKVRDLLASGEKVK